MQKAMFGAGCFWGVEDTFMKVNGVLETAVGYSGGETVDPNYKEVCEGGTKHAEVIELSFDPSIITFDKLLDIFWDIHNPTTLNRQGVDVGSQYRSAIFYLNEEQKAQAEASKDRLAASGKWNDPIVTEITAAGPFYRAEEYHQRYFEKNGGGACKI